MRRRFPRRAVLADFRQIEDHRIQAGLLHRQARLAGIPQSFATIATELTNLREVVNFHAPANRERGGRLRTSTTYTETTPLQSQLVKLFDLDALKATRS